MIKIKKQFAALKEANLPNRKEMAKKYGHDYIIKLFYNENKFGPSPMVKDRIEIKSPQIYPEYKEPGLTKALAQKFNLDTNHFYISNGSDAILDAIPTLFADCREEHNVIIPGLTFGRIETTCQVEGLAVKKVPLQQGTIDLDKIYEAIDKDTVIIYIVNPNMPTGTLISHADIVTFIKKVPKHILIVIDEAYIEYATSIKKAYENDKKIITMADNVIITHTFSKLYALASFRIGFMIARPYIVDVFRRAYQYLPVNKYSLQAAETALQDETYYDDVVKKVTKEKEKYYHLLTKLNLKYFPSFGNFIYVEVPNNRALEEFLLKKYAVAIRSVKNNAVRITIGTPAENKLVLQGMEKFYGKS